MKNISGIVSEVIETVNHTGIKNALFDSYHDSGYSLMEIENFFKEFTAKPWCKEARRVFLRNWRSPGYGAASFCALAFRILQLCEKENNSEIKNQLYFTAAQIAEIAHDDVGVKGTNHQELYEQFAYQVSGDDEWKLNKYYIPGVQNFLTKARQYRQYDGDIKNAISLSLPEELYNHGEFLFIAPLFTKWYTEVFKLPVENAQNDLKFIIAHLGTTESHHFDSAVKGLESYCTALNFELDSSIIYRFNRELLANKAAYFGKLMTTLMEVA